MHARVHAARLHALPMQQASHACVMHALSHCTDCSAHAPWACWVTCINMQHDTHIAAQCPSTPSSPARQSNCPWTRHLLDMVPCRSALGGMFGMVVLLLAVGDGTAAKVRCQRGAEATARDEPARGRAGGRGQGGSTGGQVLGRGG